MVTISGSGGNDIIQGTNDDDILTGLGGNDRISGEGGDDSINGNSGDDILYGDLGEGTAQGFDASPLVLNISNLVSDSSVGVGGQVFGDSNAQAGDVAVYSNVATLEDNTVISARLILTTKSDPNLTVDLSGGAGYEILLNGASNNNMVNQTASFRLEFFDPATGDDIALNSIATWGDLDRNGVGDQESVSINSASFGEYAVAPNSSLSISTINDSLNAAGTEANDPSDQDAWFSAALENREFIEFTLETRSSPSGFSLSGNLIDDPVVTPFEEGDDTVEGGLGHDQIFGQGGNDILYGGEGDDVIFGGTGNDQISGGLGNDTVAAGSGNDTVNTGSGADIIGAGDGADSIISGADNDIVYGDAGNDTIDGRDGNDTLYGGEDNDLVMGGRDDDEIYGGESNDNLFGGLGNDVISGGTGNDISEGGEGNDLFIYNAGDGIDTITDFGNDIGDPNDGDLTNNDFIDLSGYYNQINYDAAIAAGQINPVVIKNPLQWMRVDQADDGVLNDTNAGWTATDKLIIESGGNPVGPDELTTDTTGVVCFTLGSQIMTNDGCVGVENLVPGDRILTRDNGIQTIRWCGRRDLGVSCLARSPSFQPILISKGALGDKIPERDMLVSPNHRMLLKSGNAELMFGQSETLIAAKYLTGIDGVERVIASNVSYIHVMFDQHEIIYVDGAWSESFQPGEYTMRSLAKETRNEILTLFPELNTVRGIDRYQSARLALKRHETEVLLYSSRVN